MERIGRVEVICGPMFAGKTEELLRRVRRAQIAGRGVVVATHELDSRRGGGIVSTHSGLQIPSIVVSGARELAELGAQGPGVIAIDEAQFFGAGLVPAVMGLADAGATVIVAGLSVTFTAEPFEPLPSLMALADDVTALTAVCMVCGADAPFHQRRAGAPGESTAGGTGSADAASVTEVKADFVGGTEAYEARCRRHVDGTPSWRAVPMG